MSLMHQALDQSAAPGQSRRSRYNPMQRRSEHTGVFWWIVALVALLMALALLAWPYWRPIPAVLSPVQAQAAPAEESRTAPAKSPGLAAAEPASERIQPTSMASTAGTNQQPVNPLRVSAPESANTDPTPALPTHTDSLRDTSAVAATAADPEAVVSQPTPEEVALAPPAPTPTPARIEALPESADTPADPAISERASPQTTTARSGSSVTAAVARHASARQAVQTAIGQGDLDQAQQRLRTWINREPQLEEPRIWLAKLHLNQGGADQAEALLIGLQSNEALGLRGLILEQSGRYTDASRVFEALTRDEASNPQWWLHWAINLENSGRRAEARLLYQTYLEQFSAHNARLTAFATERYRALAG